MQDSLNMKLPPLNALKAFEATVRCGGFSAAALELRVSAAAVSMQVRKLEDFMGKTLFVRKNNSVALTDAGRFLYPKIAQSINGIASVTEHFLEGQTRSRLVVSTIQSLAEKWLVPAVSQFKQKHHDLGIELRIEEDPVDFIRHRIDLRVTYGGQFYPELLTTRLFQEMVVPLCTPEFKDKYIKDGPLSDVPDELLIHIDWGEAYASYPTWAAWFQKANISRYPDTQKGLRVAGAGIAIGLVAAGAGVALAPKKMSHFEREQGQLVEVSDLNLPLSYSYHAVTQHRQSKYLHSFLQVLKQHVKQEA